MRADWLRARGRGSMTWMVGSFKGCELTVEIGFGGKRKGGIWEIFEFCFLTLFFVFWDFGVWAAEANFGCPIG